MTDGVIERATHLQVNQLIQTLHCHEVQSLDTWCYWTVLILLNFKLGLANLFHASVRPVNRPESSHKS